jgi:hypothetical protein
MKIDHHMFFYHSNCKQPGIAGICKVGLSVCLMVFNATFKNISVISWRSVLLEETMVPGEKPPTCRKSLINFIT